MIELHLNITAEEALQRIDSFVDKATIFWMYSYTGEKSFLGKVKDNDFVVFQKVDTSHNCLPKLSGKVVPTDSGCRIEAKSKSLLFSKIFMKAWLVTIAIFFIVGLVVLFSQYGAGSLGLESLCFMLIPIIMFGFGFIMNHFGVKTWMRRQQELHEAFINLFNDVLQE